MQEETPQVKSEAEAEDRPDKALKKPPAPPKGGRNDKEARLAAALRENLRRRKAAPGKADKSKETE